MEGLGKVPAHWDVLRLRNVTEMRVSNVDKHSRQNEAQVRLCNYVDVYKNDRIRPGMPFMRATATANEIERFGLRSGDVLITKDSEVWNDIGVPALVEETEEANPKIVSGYHLALLRPYPERTNSGYLFRSLQSTAIASQLHVQANGVTRFGLTHNAIKSVRMPLPPLREQAAIVRFLDHADRHIQHYIRARQKLIALLAEQKQAIIHQAVTGQIDVRTGRPYSIYMKDSGVEALGKVPAHWDVLRLRNVTEMRVSNVDKHSRQNEAQVRLCNYVDVYKNDRIRPGMPFMRATATANEIERFGLRSGDVLITKDSEVWNDIGVPALVEETEEANPKIVSGYHLALLRPYPERTNSGYLFRSLQSTAIASQLHVQANGVTRFGLKYSAFEAVRMPLPPLHEQAAIVRYLDGATEEIDAATYRLRRQVTLLREYRNLLIDDVVTGRIDVRDKAAALRMCFIDIPQTVVESDDYHSASSDGE